MKTTELSRQARAVHAELAVAYADDVMDDFEVACKIRMLEWKASHWLTKREAKAVMEKVVTEYGAFTPKVFDDFPEFCDVQLARCYSVEIWLRVRPNQHHRMTAEVVASLTKLADECHEREPGLWRLWWD